MNPETTNTPVSTPQSRRRWIAAFAGVAGLGFLRAGGANAQGWRGHGPIDPEERARRMEYRIGRMVQGVGGTAQQKDSLVAIARAAMADLKPLRDQARQARRQAIDLLAAPVIDRAALERTRASQMQAADARSRRTLQAMADAAEVLTPEQRVKVADRMRQRMDRRRG